jgi:hypothetical protein
MTQGDMTFLVQFSHQALGEEATLSMGRSLRHMQRMGDLCSYVPFLLNNYQLLVSKLLLWSGKSFWISFVIVGRSFTDLACILREEPATLL